MMMVTIIVYVPMVLQLTLHLDVCTTGSLLCRQGLEGSAGEAVMPGHLAAHAELVAAAVAGSADILTPGRYPAFDMYQDLKICNATCLATMQAGIPE